MEKVKDVHQEALQLGSLSDQRYVVLNTTPIITGSICGCRTISRQYKMDICIRLTVGRDCTFKIIVTVSDRKRSPQAMRTRTAKSDSCIFVQSSQHEVENFTYEHGVKHDKNI